MHCEAYWKQSGDGTSRAKMYTAEMESLRKTSHRKCDPDLRKTSQSLNKSSVGRYPYATGSNLKTRYMEFGNERKNRIALTVQCS